MATVAQQIDYTDLYARWERGNWRATEIDFSQDRIDWHERMTPEQRKGVSFVTHYIIEGKADDDRDVGCACPQGRTGHPGPCRCRRPAHCA